MAAITSFEELRAWQRARESARRTYETTRRPKFATDRSLQDQMRRAAVSLLSNIAEGFERGSNKEFRYFLAVAKGSAGELRAQFYLALDVGILSQEEFDDLLALTMETSRMIAGLLRYLVTSDVKGSSLRETGFEYDPQNHLEL